MNASDFFWIREPEEWTLEDGTLTLTTNPHTDLWQQTYYHFRNDNAPLWLTETEEPYFSFVVQTEFSSAHHRFDQCGIVLYRDSDNWLKASIEYENSTLDPW